MFPRLVADDGALTRCLVAVVVSLVAGTHRLAHADWLHTDKVLHALLGIDRFPGTVTARNLFARFRMFC